jgi:23S rRNA (guanosine2251-2'-O)-methyltransferase
VAIEELWIAEGKKPSRTREIIQRAEKRGIPVHSKKMAELSRILPKTAHQGIVAVARKFAYTDLESVIDVSLKDHAQALLVVADHITDEGNLGALIRTAAFFSAHGLIIPKDRSARITATVLKRASGACAHLPVARVTNLGRALDLLKEKGFWIVGTTGESSASIYQFDWRRDVALIVGNEQKGLSPSVRKRCHHMVGIPRFGYVESLNVSVAGGATLSEILRQREAFQGPD